MAIKDQDYYQHKPCSRNEVYEQLTGISNTFTYPTEWMYTTLPQPQLSDIALSFNEGLQCNKEQEPMKTLFSIVVVTKKEEILLDTKVVAENNDEAKFLAKVEPILRERELTPKDVTILIINLGSVKVEENK